MKQNNREHTENYKYLLRLLSSVINNTQPPKPNAYTDWASVFYLANLHSVAGMTSYAVEKLSAEHTIPNEILDKFMIARRTELIIESNIQLETENILRDFKNQQVNVILLKGMVLKNYYPVASMRTMSDVDMLYKAEDKKQILKIFKNQDYTLNLDFDSELDFSKPPFHHYEMHTSLSSSRVSCVDCFSDVWHSALDKDGYFTLSLEDTYLYMLEHFAKHIEKAGAGIRMLMDVFVFLQKEKSNLDFSIINSRLKELKLEEFSIRVTELSESWFASDNPDTESPAATFILSSCTFGLTRNAILQTNIRKERRTGKKQNGFKYLLRKLFPDYQHICARFPSAKKLKWLYPFYIPAYWCLRLFKDRNVKTSNIGSYFIKTDSEDAARLLGVIRDFGLSSRI